MTYQKTLAMLAAVAMTAGGLAAMSPSAAAKGRQIVVTAPSDELVRHVSYADLNLASVDGQTTLNGRVDGAVADLCSEATGARDGNARLAVAIRFCAIGAWDGARPQIARAVQRARDIAATGSSTIAATAIVIALP